MYAVLLMCPLICFVPPLIDQFIDRSIDRWILISLIWNRHDPSPSLLDFFLSWSPHLRWYIGQLMYPGICCPTDVSLHPCRLSVYRSIGWSIDRSIDRLILISLIWYRHGPSPSPLNLYPLICISASPLIYQSIIQLMVKLTLILPVNARLSKRFSVSRIIRS